MQFFIPKIPVHFTQTKFMPTTLSYPCFLSKEEMTYVSFHFAPHRADHKCIKDKELYPKRVKGRLNRRNLF